LKTFDTEPQTAIIQPKILDFKRKEYFEYAGAGGGFIDQFGYPFCRGRIFDTLEKDNGQYDDKAEIFWASGACFFIRSTVYKELKGFDQDFFAHQEEIDLCWRAINKGHTIIYNSEAMVYHVGGATLQQANPQKTFLNFRNSLLMLTKNLPHNTLFQVLIIRMLLDGVAGVKYVFGGQFAHCWAIIRAHFSFYGLFLRNYKKREKNQVEKYFKTKSIVYSYYVKNGTVFEGII
jgi:GT2 family glycosyltransferase